MKRLTVIGLLVLVSCVPPPEWKTYRVKDAEGVHLIQGTSFSDFNGCITIYVRNGPTSREIYTGCGEVTIREEKSK